MAEKEKEKVKEDEFDKSAKFHSNQGWIWWIVNQIDDYPKMPCK